MTRGIRFEPEPLPGQPADSRLELQKRFQERVASGRYADLFDERVRRVLCEGAAIPGPDEELGAIRFALAKLLAEELDASKLAAGVARLTSAAVQAMKLDRARGDAAEASLAELIEEILVDLDGTRSGGREPE